MKAKVKTHNKEIPIAANFSKADLMPSIDDCIALRLKMKSTLSMNYRRWFQMIKNQAITARLSNDSIAWYQINADTLKKIMQLTNANDSTKQAGLSTWDLFHFKIVPSNDSHDIPSVGPEPNRYTECF
jgi:hypothetical protein